MRACLAALAVAVTGITAANASASVLVVGDSLGVGTEPALRAALGGASIDADNQNGRTSSQGLAILRERLRPEHDTVVFDLGTNDGPAAVALTAGNLEAARQIAEGRCLVVATLNHPPVGGARIAAQNASIRSFVAQTPNAVLVDWSGAAHAPPGSLGSDGVHATAAGYALRGALFADAIAGCLPGGSAAADASRSTGPAASSTRRPAGRGDDGWSLRMALRDRMLGLLSAGLAFDGGPIDLADRIAAKVGTAAGHLRDALTPRGPEPVLGARRSPL